MMISFSFTIKYKTESWLGDSSTSVTDGIQWKGGTKRSTSGISVWSEPFIVKKDSKEVSYC